MKSYTSKKKALEATLEDSLDLCLDNIKMCLGEDFDTFEILESYGLAEGTAYNHETGETYTLVGFVIDYSYVMLFENSTEPINDIGFFAVWSSSKKPYDPIFFFESSEGEIDSATHFENGSGDFFDITKIHES